MIRKQDALDYHSGGRPGKIEIRATKPTRTQRDLGLAYSPGVAEPCLEIKSNPEDVFTYTTKSNLVAVVTNGTAVLGLGNIGPMAAKPVMEGKGVLFKTFADIDVFDIELDARDPDDLIRVVKALEPTFGGINLEDIKAPDCFYIEETLKKEMDIPVFHDDQHGTSIICGAALLNWFEIAGKDPAKVKLVINGAGAGGVASAELAENLGIQHDNIIMCDSKGVIYKGRTEGMNPYKERYAVNTKFRSLGEALENADAFMGLSVKDAVSKDMVASMAEKPLVMALANPDPEISWEDAMSVRDDVIMATGRSDFPNQVNNVLGFPFIFRGALDVRARAINMEMKLAATHALADLAKEDVPEVVIKAYGAENAAMQFGPSYIIPTPFDPRVLTWAAPAVAKAAMETGVARTEIDIDAYPEKLESRLGRDRAVMRTVIGRAKQETKRIVFPEGEEVKILRAAQHLVDEGIASPILLGRRDVIEKKIDELAIDPAGMEFINPTDSDKLDDYAEELYEVRNRRGVTRSETPALLHNPNMFGSMMVHRGDADAMVAGLTQHYPDTIRPALQVIRVKTGARVAGVYMMVFKNDVKFFADTTVIIEPTAEELADIAIQTAEVAKRFNVEPRIAMLSFSNFGSTKHPLSERVRRATEMVRERAPELEVDGEMQADTAVVDEILAETYPFSRLQRAANVLVFPCLEAGNIAYKLIQRLADAEAVGPILVGLNKPVHVLQRGAEVDEIIDMAAIAAVDAQNSE